MDPPAESDNEVPYCFGIHDSGTFPCGECSVAYQCELQELGLRD